MIIDGIGVIGDTTLEVKTFRYFSSAPSITAAIWTQTLREFYKIGHA